MAVATCRALRPRAVSGLRAAPAAARAAARAAVVARAAAPEEPPPPQPELEVGEPSSASQVSPPGSPRARSRSAGAMPRSTGAPPPAEGVAYPPFSTMP